VLLLHNLINQCIISEKQDFPAKPQKNIPLNLNPPEEGPEIQPAFYFCPILPLYGSLHIESRLSDNYCNLP
jgi:hypothetical protein